MAYPVSNRWLPSVKRGMHPLTVVDVRIPSEGTVLKNLPIEGGSITVDRTSMIRTSGSVVVPEPSLSPFIRRESPLLPQGSELVIRSGIIYPEGRRAWARGESLEDLIDTSSVELIPVGIFPIYKADSSEADGGIATVNFYDRMKNVERDDRPEPIDFGGMQIQEAIEAIMDHAAPLSGLEWITTFDDDVDNFLLPYGTIMDGKPIDFLEELGESLGADIYFDRDGNPHVSKIPALHIDEEIVPDWVFEVGNNGTLMDASRVLNRENVYNGVVVIGSGDEGREVPFAFVRDEDPRSPTVWGGQFGKAVLKIEDSNLTTDLQCEKVALTKLRERSGLEEPLDFDIVGHPAFDPNDICEVQFLSGGSKVSIIDSYTYDFATTEVSGDTRAIQYVEAGDE